MTNVLRAYRKIHEPLVADALGHAPNEEERDPEPRLDRLPDPIRLEVAVIEEVRKRAGKHRTART